MTDRTDPAANPVDFQAVSKIYVAGPMSRESFCRCNRPAPGGTLPVAADLVGPRMGDAVPPPDVLVGHARSAVGSHGRLVGHLSDGSLLPERDLLPGASGTTLAQQGKHVSQEADGVMAVGRPLEEGLLAEPIRGVGTADTTDAAPLDHEVKDVSIGRGDLDSQGSRVGGSVDDGSLPLVEASAPGDVSGCPFHDFILPDDGIDPWDFNYPAFNTAAARLRTAGFEVLNPAETDTRMGTTPGEQSWQWYMRHALRMLADADGVALLDGWERSRGATLEHRIARSLNLPTGTVGLWIEAYR